MEKHLLQAAERGDAEAQFNLGVMHENGVANSRYSQPVSVSNVPLSASQPALRVI